jgi:hypothetical protein
MSPASGSPLDLYLVRCEVVDTLGEAVEAGERFDNAFVTAGPSERYVRDRFAEHCDDLGFEVPSDGSVDVEVVGDPEQLEPLRDADADRVEEWFDDDR